MKPAALRIFSLVIFSICSVTIQAASPGADVISSALRELGVDTRTLAWNLSLVSGKSSRTLNGNFSDQTVLTALQTHLKADGRNVRVLPDSALGEKNWAVVRVPVASLNSSARFNSPVSTQLVMGTPVRLLEFQSPWYRVQSPDGYVAWVHRLQIQRMTREELAQWNRCERVVVNALEAPMADVDRREPRGVLPRGSILCRQETRMGVDTVRLPDGKLRLVDSAHLETFSKDSIPDKQLADLRRTIVHEASRLIGRPYVWGGATETGMDCSGLVQTVFRAADVVSVRDAVELANIVPRSRRNAMVLSFQPGDLLFFGKRDAAGNVSHVSHVAIATGELGFIHSLGDVHAASLDPSSPVFDAGERRRFLFAVSLRDLLESPCMSTYGSNGHFLSDPVAVGACRYPR